MTVARLGPGEMVSLTRSDGTILLLTRAEAAEIAAALTRGGPLVADHLRNHRDLCVSAAPLTMRQWHEAG